MTITTIHMIPEILFNVKQPVHGDRYVLAELGPDDRIDIYKEYPIYNLLTDTWVFSGSTCKKDEEHFWLPEGEFLQIVASRNLELDFSF